MTEEKKEEEKKVENEAPPEEEKKEEPEMQEEAPPKEEEKESEFDAETAYGELQKALELQAQKLASMEETLDKVLEEEEEAALEEAPEKKEEEVKQAEDEEKEKEKESKLSEDKFIKLEGRMKAIEAQLGFKKSISSSTKKTDPISDEALADLKRGGLL